MDDKNRELLLTYLGEQEPEYYVDGITTDVGILDIYAGICGRESDAWLLHTLGLLPDWWRLVATVQVRNLDTYPDEEDRPEMDAQMRLADLTEAERDALRFGWQVLRTSTTGRIARRVDRRQRFVLDPVFALGLERLRPPVLGPMQEWRPRVQVEELLLV